MKKKMLDALDDKQNRHYLNKQNGEIILLPLIIDEDDDYQTCEREKIMRKQDNFVEIKLPVGTLLDWQLAFIEQTDDLDEEMIEDFNYQLKTDSALTNRWNIFLEQKKSEFLIALFNEHNINTNNKSADEEQTDQSHFD